MNEGKYGLHVENDGTITMKGKPYYGFGVNLYSTFAHCYEQYESARFREDFALLRKWDIPYARIPFSGYGPGYYDFFDAHTDEMLARMEAVLDEAEKNHVGLILSLMWWDPALSAHVGEKRSAMGDVNSKTIAYAKRYVSIILEHFADRRCIWGWEIGNEYNLTADLCDPAYKKYLWPDRYEQMPHSRVNGYDFYTSEELQVFFREIASLIRQYDAYRLISSGNGEMRACAHALHMAAQKKDPVTHLWQLPSAPECAGDTQEDFYAMNAYMTPEPMDTMCFHLQHGTLHQEPPRYTMTVNYWGEMSHGRYFEEYVKAAKQAKKGLFFGEFGDFIDAEHLPDLEEKFVTVLNWVVDAGIQLAATWQFAASREPFVVDEGRQGMKLTHLRAANEQFRQAGKQPIDGGWSE